MVNSDKHRKEELANTDPLKTGEVELADLEGPRVDRRTTIKIFGAAGLAGLAGCLGDNDDAGDDTTAGVDDTADDGAVDDTDDDSEESPTEDSYGGRLQYAIHRTETGELNPGTQPSIQVNQILHNTFSGLLRVDSDLSLIGDAAADWEFENDGRTIVFELKEGIMFHSGNELTAEDVQFTLHKNMEEETTHALDHLIPNIEPEGVEVVDDYTVAVNMQEVLAGGLVFFDGASNPASLIQDKAAIEERGESDYYSTPSGSGAFEITEHVVDSSITLERNDNYFEEDEDGNQLPYLDGIDVRLVPESASTMAGLQTGEIDLVDRVDETLINEFAGIPELVLESRVDLMTRAITFNTKREPFDNRDFRMAIARAIDKEAMVQEVWFGSAEPAHGPYSPVMEWLHREDYENPQAYDPEWAEQTIQENGWEDTSITFHTWASQERLGIVLRQQLSQVGLDMDVNTQPTGVMQEERAAGEFDVTPYATVGDLDPDQILSRLYHPSGGAAWHQYESEELSQMLEDQKVELDDDARLQLLHDIEDYLNENAIGIYVAHQHNLWGRHERVQGIEHLPSRMYMEEARFNE